ncbi:MAG: nickel pincer cofactor biosynthesis protein LarC [Oscillatoriophycideae cyanobacterium NC_groundwater_1537_Pr4_S-0.65um_50_18]|nr:nickel pincer cofactor biosynthesis protein LarC [Oscillatoriophycideae cyanobacterium NC_groundwater_1537_Pr4_S-0.65um_50_18]
MTKIAYLECPTGIAGDMCLGALVDGGVPLDYLIEKLGLLGIADEFRLWAEQVHRNGQQATKVHVELASGIQEAWGDIEESSLSQASQPLSHAHSTHPPHSHPPHESAHIHDRPHTHSQDREQGHPHSGTRCLPDIEHLIKAAGLPHQAEAWSLAVFRQLAEAEGAVHGTPPEQVHFHEVGATDAIVDIVGTCLGLDWLGIEQFYCSALPVGGGTIWAAHGRLPVPAPAVLKLWEMRQVPIYSNGIARELVTPTGAAIVTTLAMQFGTVPAMTLQRVGLGAGSRDFPIPNILRLWIGESQTAAQVKTAAQMTTTAQVKAAQVPTRSQLDPKSASETALTASSLSPGVETVAVLETQVDDLNPQAIGYVFDVLLAAGALDVFTQAIGMKKSRPGILLTVICRPEQMQTCQTILFQETTTLGIRCKMQQRTILEREFQTVETQYGKVRLKIARWQKQGAIVNVQPEYEDCSEIAQHHQIPWREVHGMALQAWQSKHGLVD